MMVCALNVYAPVFINDNTLSILAAAIASGRNPSKLTINTRVLFGGGVDVTVGMGVAVYGNGVLLGMGVGNCAVTIAGGVGAANASQDDRKTTSRVRYKIRRIILR